MYVLAAFAHMFLPIVQHIPAIHILSCFPNLLLFE